MSLEVASTVVRLTRSSSFTHSHPKALKPFDSGEIKILLLENVNQRGISLLEKEGYQVNYKVFKFCCNTVIILYIILISMHKIG